MPFNPSAFKSQLQYGGARGNLFEIRMTIPFASSAASQKLTFMAKAASLPASTLGVAEVPYFGRVVPLPGDRTFAPWNFTVLNDEDFIVRNAIETWSDRIKSHNENLAGADVPATLLADFEAIQYSKAGTAIKTYTFQSGFPSEIAEIPLDWSSNNTVEEFQVTMTYLQWVSSNIQQ